MGTICKFPRVETKVIEAGDVNIISASLVFCVLLKNCGMACFKGPEQSFAFKPLWIHLVAF